jgi:Superinfection immunity protein
VTVAPPAGGVIYDVAFLFGVAFYWLPTIVALARGAERVTAVVLINLLLTWTVIGWIVALVIAFTSPRRLRP